MQPKYVKAIKDTLKELMQKHCLRKDRESGIRYQCYQHCLDIIGKFEKRDQRDRDKQKLSFPPEYIFERESFTKVWNEVFTAEETDSVFSLCQESPYLDDFIIAWDEDTFYFIHKKSCTIITFYKHIGRCNTCSNQDLDLDDLKKFFTLLKEDLIYKEKL